MLIMIINFQVFICTFAILLLPAIYSFNLRNIIKSFGIGLINYWLVVMLIIFLSNILNIQYLSRGLLIVFNLVVFGFFIKNFFQKPLIHVEKHFYYYFIFLIFFSLFLSQVLDRYLIVGWDEYAKILLWTKTIFLTNNIYDSSLSNFILGDNPGLPILLASPTILFNYYQEYMMVVVYLSFHLSLLFLIYEFLNKTFKNNLFLNITMLLLYLVAEFSWKLLPENLQYENIQIYLFSSIFLIFIYYKKKFFDENSLLISLLTLLILLIFLKSNYVTVLPIIFLFLVLHKVNYKKLIIFMSPVIILLILIKMQISDTSRCHVNPFSSGSFVFEEYLYVTSGIMSKTLNWLLNWKLIITIFASVFFLTSFRNKDLIPISLLFLLWLIVYFVAVSLVINNCFTVIEKNHLFAVERYLSIPFRSFHIIGFLCFICFIPRFNKLITKLNIIIKILIPILLILLFKQLIESSTEITTRVGALKFDSSYNKIKYYNDYLNDNDVFLQDNFTDDIDLSYYELVKEYNQLELLIKEPLIRNIK
jgi:hypothetical protein